MAEIYIVKLPDWHRTVTTENAPPYIMSPYQGGAFGIHQYMVMHSDTREQTAQRAREAIYFLAQAGFGGISFHDAMQQDLHWQNTKLVPEGVPLLCEGQSYPVDALRTNHDLAFSSFFMMTVDNWDELPDAPNKESENVA